MPSTVTSQRKSVSEYSRTTTQFDHLTGKTSVNSHVSKSSQVSLFSETSRNWVQTPNYRAIVKAGGILPDNPLSFEKIDNGHFTGGVVNYYHQAPGGSWTRIVSSNELSNSYVPPILRNPWNSSAHSSKLLKKAKAAEWSAPVFFAELGKTADMVYKTATRITSMFVALRKGNLRRFVDLWHPSASKRLRSKRSFERAQRKFGQQFGRNPREAVSSAWLEYKYGWTPFVLDVHNAFETLSDVQAKPENNVGRVVSVLTAKSVDSFYSDERLLAIAGYNWGGTMKTTYDLSSRAVWRFTINENLNLIGKVGLTNPLMVGWELVPLSFVADWFLPIGDYLASLDAPMRFSHVGGTIGYKCSADAQAFLRSYPTLWKVSPMHFAQGKRVAVTVKPMTGVPEMKLLDMEFLPNLKHGRAISAIALLSGTIKSHHRI